MDLNLKEISELIYKDYRIHAAKSLLLRSGHLLVGCCDTPEHIYSTEPLTPACDPHRPDSVSEHTDGLITLACSVSMWAPHLLPPAALPRITRLLLYHDAAETIRGDAPDDGSRNDNQKDLEEFANLSRMLGHWPHAERVALLDDFIKFQNHDGPEFQVAYCIDKAEAILRLLEYERAGIVGTLKNKPHMSAQDRRFAEEIGTFVAADGWARHAFLRLAGCKGYDLAYWLFHTGFTDVRGSAPAWMEPFAPADPPA